MLSSYQTWERISYTFTLTEETEILGFQFQGIKDDDTNYKEVNTKFKNIQLEKGSTPTKYMTYEYGVGNTNLLDLSQFENGTVNGTTGQNYKQENRVRTGYIFLEAGNYTISSIEGVRCAGNLHKYSTANEQSWLGALQITRETIENKTIGTVTLDEDCYVRFSFLPVDETVITDLSVYSIQNYNPQLEKGLEATEYEQYGQRKNYTIILDEQLKDGNYIDFKLQKLVRADGTEENIKLPEILTFEDYTKIEVLTEVVPSKIEVEYVGYDI